MSTKNLLVTNVSGWSRTLGAATAYAADTTDWSGDNADKFTTSGKNKSDANFLETSGTWEALFGIPAGSTVTTIGTPDDFDWQCLTYTTGAASTAGPLELRNSGGTLQLTLATGSSYSSTVARTTKAGTSQAVPSGVQPSNTTIRLRLNSTQATGNSSSAVNALILGHVNVTITYTTAYVLTAASGSFTETGGAATPGVGATAGAGSYTETGGAATLTPKIPAGAGSYTETGGAATLNAHLSLLAGAGALAETGGSATPSVGLGVGAGSFAETGAAATLGLGLGSAAGSFTESGGGSVPAVGMGAGAGTFVETGHDATLTLTGGSQSYHLIAAVGAFVLTGHAATLTYQGRRLYVVGGTGGRPEPHSKDDDEETAQVVPVPADPAYTPLALPASPVAVSPTPPTGRYEVSPQRARTVRVKAARAAATAERAGRRARGQSDRAEIAEILGILDLVEVA